MKKIYKFIFIILAVFSITFKFENVKALEKLDYKENTTNSIVKMDNPNPYEGDEDANCEYILGDPNDDRSVAYMLQKVFDYVKIIGPLLVIALSGFDFAKTAFASDDDAMKKASKKLVTRLVCAALLFFVPIITSFMLNLVNKSSYEKTCGIS